MTLDEHPCIRYPKRVPPPPPTHAPVTIRWLCGLLLACLLVSAALLKAQSFDATAQYVSTSLPLLAPISRPVVVVLVAVEVAIGVPLIARPNSFVWRSAGWLFVCFAGWHLSGLLIHAPACPCLGPVTASMNAQANQITFGTFSAIVGAGLVLIPAKILGRPS